MDNSLENSWIIYWKILLWKINDKFKSIDYVCALPLVIQCNFTFHANFMPHEIPFCYLF